MPGKYYCSINLITFRIKDIPPSAFQDLHSLEWIKLYNNVLRTLHYELMEPVLDTLQHIDIHSKQNLFFIHKIKSATIFVHFIC